MKMKGVKAKVEMYALVRDKNGNPKVDVSLKELHPSILEMLTPEDIKYLKEKELNNGNS